MPLALMIQDFLQKMDRELKKLDGWNQLVQWEAVLVGRARGAFLTHWFGTHLPLDGHNPRIWIVNIEELKQQRDAIKRTDSLRGGPNLLEPLAGLAGLLAGEMLTPLNAALLGIYYAKSSRTWWSIILAGLNVGVGGMLGAVLAVVLGAGALFALPALGMLPIAPALYNLFAALAEMAAPFRSFWLILNGDRRQVANPVLAEMLHILDQAADLLPQMMGFLTVMIRDLRFRLLALAPQIAPLALIVMHSIQTFQYILENVVEHLDQLMTGPHSIVAIMERALNSTLSIIPILTTRVPAALKAPFVFLRAGLNRMSADWDLFSPALTTELDAIKNAPFWTELKQAGERFTWAASVFAGIPSKPRTQQYLRHPIDYQIADLVDRFTAMIPSFNLTATAPVAPALPDTDLLTAELGGEPPSLGSIGPRVALREIFRGLPPFGPWLSLLQDPFSIVGDSAAGLEAARNPRSVFSGEWARLHRELGRNPTEALRRFRVRELSLRQHVEDIVNTVFPDSLTDVFSPLESTLRKIDESLHLPDLAVPETGRLNVRAPRLRILAEERDRTAVQAWAQRLRTRLSEQQYLVPVLP